MAENIRNETAQKASNTGKRAWIAPEIDIARARDANAFGGPPGGVDYGIYS